jgi:hypothetical protein
VPSHLRLLYSCPAISALSASGYLATGR